MPQARNNRIPSAHNGYELPQRKKGVDHNDGKPNGSGASYATEAFSPQRSGVLPFPWEWQLAGLISNMVTGLVLLAASVCSSGVYPFLLLVGLGLLGLSIYTAVKTNWLRDTEATPLPVKIGAGTAVICGLVPIAAALLGIAIVGGILAILTGALGSK